MGILLVDSQRDEVYQYLLVDVGGVADITTLIWGGELVLARRLRGRFEEDMRLLDQIDELKALLEAAGELDEAARIDHRIGRRAAIGALALAGFRISELCDLRCAEVDLTRARYKVRDAKTAKGIREVEMTEYSRELLLAHSEQRERDGFPMTPEDYFFGARQGGRRDPNRFRDRVLERSVELANKRRSETGRPPLPRITPHSLRRTWAMLAAQAGRDPKWISDEIGHTSAAFTLQVYQQTRHRRLSAEERQAIWQLMRFADEPEECPLTHRTVPTR